MSTSSPDIATAQRRKGHHGANVGHHSRHAVQARPQQAVHVARLNEAQATPAAATAPTAAPQKRGHHPHHGGHHHHQAPNGTSAVSNATTLVAHQNATSGVVSRITTHPPGAVVSAPVAYSPPPPEHSGGLSGGAIFGLVVCILAVFGVAGFVVYRVWRKRNHMDPMFTMAPGHRGGYWGRRESHSHSHIVSPPPDDDITSFDQDFKHWVEVVGSASGKPFPANNASTKYYNNSTSSGINNAKRPTLNRIPSGVEPVGSTENGTLVFQDTPKIRVDRSTNSDTGSMVNEPVSPLKAPPGFGPFGGATMKLDPPPNPPSGVRAPPFQH